MSSPRGAYGKPPAKPRTLGERIRAVRLAWGWSQSRLAQAVHSDQRTLSAWERDFFHPTNTALGAIAQLFGLPAAALESGKGFSIPDEPRQVGTALLAESVANSLVALPPIGEEDLMLVDRRSGECKGLAPRQIAAILREAKEEGRSVWLVLG